MTKKIIKLMIADDNSEIASILKDYFNLTEDIKVCNISRNGKEALEYLESNSPDVLILDIIMPHIDGLGVLEEILKKHGTRPKIIVVSAIGQESIAHQAMSLGADYYIVKPFDIVSLSNRIRSLLIKTINTVPRVIEVQALTTNQLISNTLISAGIPMHVLGYKYLNDAILLTLDEGQSLSVTKYIYPTLAKKYFTSASCIEKAIRHAVNYAYKNNRTHLNSFFSDSYLNNDGKKPSNSEIISTLSGLLKLKIEE